MSDFILDAYKDWSNEQLKARCRELVSAVSRLELMVAMMTEYGPDILERLPGHFREKAKLLNAAYRDDESTTPSGTPPSLYQCKGD